MAFDHEGASLKVLSDGFKFVENLLSKALSFSLESLETDPESFVEFLDLTSQLRLLVLEEIDLTTRHAFCLFANIYHCLLQQALLLSVNGPLDKKNIGLFMRTSCYEIGGDVFSLAELYCCVLRGKMCKAVNPKPPYIEASRKSSKYRHYALSYNDPRVNFVLVSFEPSVRSSLIFCYSCFLLSWQNTGDTACPQTVPILRPSDLEDQLNVVAAAFLKKELVIDTRRRLVLLPKVCEIYKHDFGSDSLACLKFCMQQLDEGAVSTIRAIIGESHLVIRYQHISESYHSLLKYRDDLAGAHLNQVL